MLIPFPAPFLTSKALALARAFAFPNLRRRLCTKSAVACNVTTNERYSVQSRVDKYRTGSGSDRVEHSAWTCYFLRHSEFYVEPLTRSLQLPVLNLSTH